jgi:tetratricopeptide (TPR) repeat protein
MRSFRFCSAAVALGLLLAVRAPAQPMGPVLLLTSDSSRALLEAAHTQTLRLRFDSAEATLRTLQRRPDGAAAALHNRATLALLRGLITDEGVQFTRFTQRADSLDDVLRRYPETRWRLYYEAESALLRALVHARAENLTRAALAGRTAYNRYEKALRGHPEFADAQRGFGLLNLLVGSAPGAYRWMLRLMGYEGTVEGGRARLAQAAEHAEYAREEAALVLSLLDIVVRGDRKAGLDRLDALHRVDPSRALVAYLYGYALLSNRQAEAAERVLAAVVAAQAQPGTQPLEFARYYLADAHFKLGRHDEAIEGFRAYLMRHRGNALRAGAQIRLALALELQGRRAEALPVYRQIRRTRISETEEMAVRLAHRRLATPMTASERTLLEATNLYEAGRYADAAARLEPLLAGPLSPTLAAEARVRLGRVLQATQRLADARAQFEAAVAAPGDDPLAGWGPWAHLHLGQIAAEEGRRDEARRHYETALRDERSFDFHLSLEQHARTALEKLR